MKPTDTALSRREFARRAALGSAAIVSGEWRARSGEPGVEESAGQTTPEAAKLSPESQAEAESRYKAILEKYGERFSEAQKADLRRLCLVIQNSVDKVRGYPVGNDEQPAVYLKPVVEREKKSGAPPNLKLAPSPGDKSARSPGDDAASPATKPSASAERSDEWRVASDEKSQESGNPAWAGPNQYKPGSGKP